MGGRALFEGGDYLRDAYYLRKYSILSTYGNLQNSRGQLWERDLVPSPHNMFTLLFDQRLTFTSTLLFLIHRKNLIFVTMLSDTLQFIASALLWPHFFCFYALLCMVSKAVKTHGLEYRMASGASRS